MLVKLRTGSAMFHPYMKNVRSGIVEMSKLVEINGKKLESCFRLFHSELCAEIVHTAYAFGFFYDQLSIFLVKSLTNLVNCIFDEVLFCVNLDVVNIPHDETFMQLILLLHCFGCMVDVASPTFELISKAPPN